MKLVMSLLATCSIALVLFLTGCSDKGAAATLSTLPAVSTPASTQQADDVLPTPGGYAYRGNVNEQGQTNPFSAIQTTDVILSGGHVTYREDIQTASGRTRHNIVAVYPTYNGLPTTPSQISVNLSLNSLPAGSDVTANIGDQWFGPGTTETILSFVISPQAATGDYQFIIGVQVNGQTWGTVPCTVQVTS